MSLTFDTAFDTGTPYNINIRDCYDINLTATDPIERLEQFCTQASFSYEYRVFKFRTGVVCRLEIKYFQKVENARKVPGTSTYFMPKIMTDSLISESRYFPGDDISTAQKVVAAILLDHLGLAPVEEVKPAETEAPPTENNSKLESLGPDGSGPNGSEFLRNSGTDVSFEKGMEAIFQGMTTRLGEDQNSLQKFTLSTLEALYNGVQVGPKSDDETVNEKVLWTE